MLKFENFDIVRVLLNYSLRNPAKEQFTELDRLWSVLSIQRPTWTDLYQQISANIDDTDLDRPVPTLPTCIDLDRLVSVGSTEAS